MATATPPPTVEVKSELSIGEDATAMMTNGIMCMVVLSITNTSTAMQYSRRYRARSSIATVVMYSVTSPDTGDDIHDHESIETSRGWIIHMSGWW